MVDNLSTEEKVKFYMRTLACTEAEARELIADDADVDKGKAKPWDLSAEQIKNQRKLANATTRKVNGKSQRTKKENPDKRAIVNMLAEALANMDGVSVTNPERAIDFTCNGVSYTVTLTAHRG